MNWQQGDIVIAKLNPNQGAEIGKLRPVIILTKTRLIQAGLPMIFIVPLSSALWPKMQAFRQEIPARQALETTSYAVIEQARSISRHRLDDEIIGKLTHREIKALLEKLHLIIDVDTL